jgi:hypothetical protein
MRNKRRVAIPQGTDVPVNQVVGVANPTAARARLWRGSSSIVEPRGRRSSTHCKATDSTACERAESLRRPEWMDTVNLAPNESLDLIMDFTDLIIRGVSVFHRRLLKHEDKGMMAKTLFE